MSKKQLSSVVNASFTENQVRRCLTYRSAIGPACAWPATHFEVAGQGCKWPLLALLQKAFQVKVMFK